MNLFRVSEFDSGSRQAFEDADIMQFEVWAANGEKIGKVSDILMDDIGQLYYLIANIGSWLNRKPVLIKPEQFQIDRKSRRINLVEIDKEHLDQLPVYDSAFHQRAARQAEVAINGGIQTSGTQAVLPVEASATLEYCAPLGLTPLVEVNTHQNKILKQRSADDSTVVPTSSPHALNSAAKSAPPQAIDSLTSQQEPIRLLEERLIVNRIKRKVGEVVVRKEIETRIIEIPIRREKLVIEQVSPDQKHLATVDLPSEISDAELVTFAQTTLDSIENNNFVSAEIAQRVLSHLLSQSGSAASRVKLVFEDASLQAKYDRQLAQPRVD
jgi:PRC-barrel domain/Domain of unknown function (DUF2382)